MVNFEGFPSPMTALVLLISKLLALKPPATYDVGQRRLKNNKDSRLAGLPPGRDIESRDFPIPGPGGNMPVRFYRRSARGSDALILYFHGGGWALGTLDSHDSVARGMCRSSGADVLSVDYRLAPEHPFPAATEDVLAAYRWSTQKAESLGLSSSRIYVSGDSAGGGLAASLCLMCKEMRLPQPAGQILLFPVTDASRTDGESYRRFARGYLLTRADMEWFISLYCAEEQRTDTRISPLLAKDLSGLAPALVVTAQFDVLRDEGEAYAARLRENGIRVWQRRFPGTIHCFTSMGRFVPATRKVFRMVASFVNEPSSPDLPPRS